MSSKLTQWLPGGGVTHHLRSPYPAHRNCGVCHCTRISLLPLSAAVLEESHSRRPVFRGGKSRGQCKEINPSKPLEEHAEFPPYLCRIGRALRGVRTLRGGDDIVSRGGCGDWDHQFEHSTHYQSRSSSINLRPVGVKHLGY